MKNPLPSINQIKAHVVSRWLLSLLLVVVIAVTSGISGYYVGRHQQETGAVPLGIFGAKNASLDKKTDRKSVV